MTDNEKIEALYNALYAIVIAEFGDLYHPQINDSSLWGRAGEILKQCKNNEKKTKN